MRKVKKRSLTSLKTGGHFGIRPPNGQAVRRPSGAVMIVPPSHEERIQIDNEMQKYIQRKKEALSANKK